jgi:hypothetical protein
LTVATVTADVAGGGEPLLLQTIGQGPQAQHEIVDNGSVVLSKTRKHGGPAKDEGILTFSSGFRE